MASLFTTNNFSAHRAFWPTASLSYKVSPWSTYYLNYKIDKSILYCQSDRGYPQIPRTLIMLCGFLSKKGIVGVQHPISDQWIPTVFSPIWQSSKFEEKGTFSLTYFPGSILFNPISIMLCGKSGWFRALGLFVIGELALPGTRQEICFPFMNKVTLNFLTGEGFNLGVGAWHKVSLYNIDWPRTP